MKYKEQIEAALREISKDRESRFVYGKHFASVKATMEQAALFVASRKHVVVTLDEPSVEDMVVALETVKTWPMIIRVTADPAAAKHLNEVLSPISDHVSVRFIHNDGGIAAAFAFAHQQLQLNPGHASGHIMIESKGLSK